MPTRSGSFRIFQFLGIDVYLHWSWFIVAFYGIQVRTHRYDSYIWPVLEYLTLFLIVLTHEFGHALACRQVGGKANQIVLWPLGGVAYVSPPQRPGATLWSIAAGPLVNLVLVPILSAVWLLAHSTGWPEALPNLYTFVFSIWFINLVLLIFNMLPIYPLDGGQILRSLLWFLVGRANSLLVASIIGFIGVAGIGLLALLAFVEGDSTSAIWVGIMAAFIALNCWGGLRQALALSKVEKAPRRQEFTCPACREAPPVGDFWLCSRCRQPFDIFLTKGFCPQCNAEYTVAGCPFCRDVRPFSEWLGATASPEPPKT
jgi:Zn-dependent protease